MASFKVLPAVVTAKTTMLAIWQLSISTVSDGYALHHVVVLWRASRKGERLSSIESLVCLGETSRKGVATCAVAYYKY